MTKELLHHIQQTYTEGVHYRHASDCSTCLEVLDQKVIDDPVVQKYLLDRG